ncbi:hypothetical protein ACFL3N_02875 [Candidatus Omnitrophota bacterium]
MIKKTNGHITKKIIWWAPLLIVCAVSFFLIQPTINNNADDLNMVAYLNSDEGAQLDIIWWYYSGQKNRTFQWEFDYGLFMRYIADFARMFLSHFIDFTPGVFLLVLRWLYFAAWIASFFALWRLVERHFAGGWQPALAVILLAVRPAFAYFSDNLKPEPLVLLLMIIGIDHTLRIIDEPLKRRNFLIAAAIASVVFLIKYAGLFLLPGIVAAIFLAKRYSRKDAGSFMAANEKIAWTFPGVIGAGVIALLFSTLFFYVRRSSSLTYAEEFGLTGSLIQNKIFLVIFLAGLLLVMSSFAIIAFSRSSVLKLKNLMRAVNELNYYSLTVFGVFLAFSLALGIRWLIDPKWFIDTYSEFGSIFIGSGILKNVIGKEPVIIFYLKNILPRIRLLGLTMLSLFGFYLFLEARLWRRSLEEDKARFFKRIILSIIFIIPFLALIFSTGRFAGHNLLPFFAVMCILAAQGIHMFNSVFPVKEAAFKKAVVAFICLLIASDIFVNARETIGERMYQFRRSEDVAFEIAEWWKANIPEDAKVAADHYIRVYIPKGHSNVKTLHYIELDRIAGLRRLVAEYDPELVYYNSGATFGDSADAPSIEEILPGKRTELVKSFEGRPGRYKRKQRDKFFIYRIIE